MRFRLRTLLIATTIGPPVLAVAWWLNLAPVVSGILIWAICAIAVCM